MKKEDLVIGHSYKHVSENRIAELVGFDNYGDPVLKPLNQETTDFYTMYRDENLAKDSNLSAGCFGLTIETFCYRYKKNER